MEKKAANTNQAEQQFKLGLKAAHIKDHKAARLHFESAIRSNPSAPHVWHVRLGMSSQAAKDLSGAVKAYRAALLLKPDEAVTSYRLGMAEQASKNWSSAEQAYLAAMKQEAGRAELHFRLGEVQGRQKKRADARSSYEKAIELDSTQPEWLMALAEACLDTDDLPSAIRYAKEALLLKENPVWHSFLAQVALRADDWATAAESYTRALALDPELGDKQAKVHYQIASCYVHLEKWSEATLHIKSAIAIKDNQAAWHAKLGQVLAAQGLNDEAVTAYHTALRIAPTQTWWREALEKLQAIEDPTKALEMKFEFSALMRDRILNARAYLRTIQDDAVRAVQRRQLWTHGAHPGSLNEIPESELASASASQLVVAAAIYAETGSATIANQLAIRALKKDPNILDKYSYVGLISSISSINNELRQRYAGEIELASQYRKHRGKFAELALSAKRIAVIANAPTVIGKGAGKAIDDCDLIIRFNDFRIDRAYEKDLGSRTDVWGHSYTYKNIWRKDHQKFKHTVLLGTSIYWRAVNGRDALISGVQSGHTIEDVDPRLYYDLALQLGMNSSSGILMLYWLQRLLGDLSNVDVYGFSMVDQVGTGPVHYYSSLQRRNPAPHFWEAERKLLDEMLSTASVVR